MLNLFDKKTKQIATLNPTSEIPNFINRRNDLIEKYKARIQGEIIKDTLDLPPASEEWVNSVYSYNKNFIKTLPAADNIVNRTIKNYFSFNQRLNQNKSKRIQIKFRRLSLNRILVSKAEMKHTNNKVIITVYVYNRNKKYLVSKLINLYKTFVLKIPSISSNTKGLTVQVSKGNSKRQWSDLKLNNTSNLAIKPKTYKALATSENTSDIKLKIDESKRLKANNKEEIKFKPFTPTKQNFSTKINSVYNKNLSTRLSYKQKIYNYINFTDLTKIRLSRFISKMKNTNLKNKYKTLVKRYYSILTKYKLYSIVSKNSDLNSINVPNHVVNKNLGLYASSFYKILKIALGVKNKARGLAVKPISNNSNPSDYKLVTSANYLQVRKSSRKIKNLMHKIRNFYKLFSLNNMYNYKLNTEIATNLNSFFGNITKMLKKSLVSQGGKKIKFITLKGIRIIKRARKNKNFLIKTLNWSNENFANYENKYYKRFITKAYKKEMLYLYYIKMLSLNNNKFKNWFLLGLKRVISKVYNKDVEFNFVNLKYLHLNSDIFTQSIVTKLQNRQNRLLFVLKKALTLVKLPTVKGKSSIFNSFDYDRNNSDTGLGLKNKSNSLSFDSYNSELLAENDTLHKSLLNIFHQYETVANLPEYEQDKSHILSNPTSLVPGQAKDVLDSIKHKAVMGVRLEAAGRLSKRLTATRSVFKLKYKGSLKNIDSSYKAMSSVILRGNTKSNIQYTKISSKTRNGSFGLKGWVSGY